MFFFIFGFFWKNIKTWVKNWVATDAIELILKIKISIEDWIEQIKNWKLIQKFDNFWRIFLLNETTRFVQNNVISLTIHKKKRSKVLFLQLRTSSSSSRRAKAGRRRFFFPSFVAPLSLSLSLWNPKKPIEGTSPAAALGQLHSGHPNHLTSSHDPLFCMPNDDQQHSLKDEKKPRIKCR